MLTNHLFLFLLFADSTLKIRSKKEKLPFYAKIPNNEIFFQFLSQTFSLTIKMFIYFVIYFLAVSKCFTANMSKVGHEVCETSSKTTTTRITNKTTKRTTNV